MEWAGGVMATVTLHGVEGEGAGAEVGGGSPI